MVPLEVEQPTPVASQSASLPVAGAALAAAAAAGVAADPISVLSRLSFKDAVLELQGAARKAGDVSAAGMLQMWQVAERRMGVEVDIEDPAMRGLFGLHVLAVEELCSRVRTHAETMLAVTDIWSQPTLDSAALDLRLLSDAECGDGSALGTAVAADLIDANRAVFDARARLMLRIQNEVCGPIDQREEIHNEVREAVRDRQRWNNFASSARKDVVWLRRESPNVSGFRQSQASSPLEEAEVRLREASAMVASIDSKLLEKLTTLSGQSVEAVRTPWAALVQIQSEFYLAQQALWHPLADSFEEYADVGSAPLRPT